MRAIIINEDGGDIFKRARAVDGIQISFGKDADGVKTILDLPA